MKIWNPDCGADGWAAIQGVPSDTQTILPSSETQLRLSGVSTWSVAWTFSALETLNGSVFVNGVSNVSIGQYAKLYHVYALFRAKLSKSGSYSVSDGYVVGYYYDNTNASSLAFRVVSGSATSLGSASAVLTSTANVLSEIEGTNIRCKVWRTTDPEPTNWGLVVTDSVISSPGEIGIRGKGNPNAELRVTGIGVHYGGFSAPRSPEEARRIITGTVTLAGTPVQGAVVVGHYIDAVPGQFPRNTHIVTATTDQNGNYSLVFPFLASGRYLLTAYAIINGVYYTSDSRLIDLE